MPEVWNFAGRLVRRIGENSHLIDAATEETLRGSRITNRIVGFAATFLSAGLRRGDRLLMSCGLNPTTALAYLGAMYGGLVPVLVEDRMVASFGESLFAKAKAKAVWFGKGARCDWAKKKGILQIEGNVEGRPADSIGPAPCEQAELAVLMPTSGSTGTPRLVMISHGNLIANTEAIIRSQHLGTDERAMLIMPLSYCFAASVMHTHLHQGGGVVFDSRFMFPDKVLHAINTYGCTTFAGVPTVYNILLRRSSLRSLPLPRVRRFLQAGGALASERVEEMRNIVPTADFFVMYGQTEATARICCLAPDRLIEKPGSVGLPLDNLVVRIVDERGQEVSNGDTGELQVSGPSVSAGYLDDPEATKSKFCDGWLRTGDFGYRDEEGFLSIVGRTGDFIKTRGLRVSFAEVEAKVAAMPGIIECAATAVPHSEAGEALALFVVAGNEPGDVTERVRRALPPQWTCASVNAVAELPRTAHGKIARFQLKTPA